MPRKTKIGAVYHYKIIGYKDKEMKKLLFIFIACSFIYTPFLYAGSSDAELRCKSKSGRTIFNATIQDITGLLQRAELIIDGKSLSFINNENNNYENEIFAIFDPEHKVFTLHIEGKTNEKYPNHKYVDFWAIPSSFKFIKNTGNEISCEFKAKLYGTDTRPNKYTTPTIELNCTLDYSI